jgi:hypothetical protein
MACVNQAVLVRVISGELHDLELLDLYELGYFQLTNRVVRLPWVFRLESSLLTQHRESLRCQGKSRWGNL